MPDTDPQDPNANTDPNSGGDPNAGGGDPAAGADTVLAEIKALADELGITPGQLKGRLDASRKWEQRAKDNATAATELAELRKTQMSDADRAIAEAKAQGETEATKRFGQQLAAAKIEAALAGIVDNPAEVIDELNLAKYVTDTGDVDSEAVTKLRDRFAAIAKREPADFGGGTRGGDVRPPAQLTQADLAKMTSAEINKARREGRLANLIG